jgi:hypothetical protein
MEQGFSVTLFALGLRLFLIQLQINTHRLFSSSVLAWHFLPSKKLSPFFLQLQINEVFKSPLETLWLAFFTRNPVHPRRLVPSVLAFSLSWHRHPSICILFNSRFTSYNKHIFLLWFNKRKRTSSTFRSMSVKTQKPFHIFPTSSPVALVLSAIIHKILYQPCNRLRICLLLKRHGDVWTTGDVWERSALLWAGAFFFLEKIHTNWDEKKK